MNMDKYNEMYSLQHGCQYYINQETKDVLYKIVDFTTREQTLSPLTPAEYAAAKEAAAPAAKTAAKKTAAKK